MSAFEFAYINVEVADPAAFGTVLAEVVGLQPGASSGSTQSWRNDGAIHRVLVDEGPGNDAVAVGYAYPTTDDLDAAVARLTELGYDVQEGSDAERSARAVERLQWCTAPWGTRVELVTGLADAADPFASPLMPGGFLTEGVGFGHCVFMVPDHDASHRFVVDGLGFAQTDWIEVEFAPGVGIEGRFYHSNPRHHTLALIAAPAPPPGVPTTSLHHIMFEANQIDDVGAAFDRAYAAGLPIPNGIGKHDNDRMTSFYLQTPAGFQIEVGTGARTVGEDWSENRRYESISAWGHQPVVRG
ncbi:MAG: VOC family protein [Acidimicrobiales bacterium]